jgi:hypothetical protein
MVHRARRFMLPPEMGITGTPPASDFRLGIRIAGRELE